MKSTVQIQIRKGGTADGIFKRIFILFGFMSCNCTIYNTLSGTHEKKDIHKQSADVFNNSDDIILPV